MFESKINLKPVINPHYFSQFLWKSTETSQLADMNLENPKAIKKMEIGWELRLWEQNECTYTVKILSKYA